MLTAPKRGDWEACAPYVYEREQVDRALFACYLRAGQISLTYSDYLIL